PDFHDSRLFDPHMRDHYTDPYIYLRERLAKLGYRLDTADDHPVEECDWLFFFDVPSAMASARSRLRQRLPRALGRPVARDLFCRGSGGRPARSLCPCHVGAPLCTPW